MTPDKAKEILKEWFEEISTDKIIKVNSKSYLRRNALSFAIQALEEQVIDSESWWEGDKLMFRLYQGKKPIVVSDNSIRCICHHPIDVIRQCDIKEVWENKYSSVIP